MKFPDFVRMQMKQQALNYEDVARRADGIPSAKRVQQIVLEDIEYFSRPPILLGFHRALGVPMREIILAQCESIGLPMEDRRSLLETMLPSEVDLLDEDDVFPIIVGIRRAIQLKKERLTAKPPRTRK